ncbi:cation:proton antiporter [Actinomadura gamaensis]|uniref:Cation:proton antiporter n=1 Tax=Actinomadura gamaensis TaxID=1763541 RepID=A0ABV9TUN2_9ACTN
MIRAAHPAVAAPVAPIGTHVMLVFLLQIALLLGAALLLGLLARRLGMPAIVGELCAGVLLGPSVLAHAAPALAHWLLPARPEQQHLLDAVGQLGVLLLVGVTGMNVDLGMIRRQGLTAARVSAGGLVLPLAAGFGVGLLLPGALLAPGGDRTVFAAFVAVAMCVSAIPVIAKTLLEMRLLHRDVGQLIVGASVVDDMVGWLLLSVVSAAATTGVRAGHLVFTVGMLLGGIALALTLGRPVVRTLLSRAARSPEPAVTVATAVGVVVLCAAGTQALGVEPVVGAFFGGLLISAVGWEAAPQRMTSLRTFAMGVLAPLFFATAGLRMDLTALVHPDVLGAAVLVLAVAVVFKFAGAYLGARASRLGHWEALALGAGMNARGVIEVIIAMVGLRLGVLSTEMYTVVVLVAIATSLMAPPLLRTAVRRIEVTGAEREREKVLLGG